MARWRQLHSAGPPLGHKNWGLGVVKKSLPVVLRLQQWHVRYMVAAAAARLSKQKQK